MNDDREHDLDERASRRCRSPAGSARSDRRSGRPGHPGRQAGLDLLDLRFLTRSITSSAFSPWRMTTMPETTSPAPSRSDDAAPQVRPQHDLADVPDPDRACRSGCAETTIVLEVGDRLRVAAAAHHVLGAAEFDQPAAHLVVAAAHRLDHPLDRDAVGLQPVRIDVHLVLAAEAAERRDLGDARDRLAGSSAGTSPGTSAARRGCAVPTRRRARTGRPSPGPSRRARVPSSTPCGQARQDAARGTPASASAPSRCRCRRRR